jgi:hypothetical protein
MRPLADADKEGECYVKDYNLGQVVATLSLVCGVGMCAAVHAAGDTGLVTIQEVHIEGSVFTSANSLSGTTFANPDGCGAATTVILPSSVGGYAGMQAMLLAAVASGKQVHFWVSGCYAYWGSTYPMAGSVSIAN